MAGIVGRQLLVGRGSGKAATPVGIDDDARRVAVLYFQSSGDSLRYLADGLTEGLIGELAQVPELEVISRNGVVPFRGSGVPRDSVARALKVGTLVEGSVEQEKDRVRVTVRLIDAASNAEFQRASFEQPASAYLSLSRLTGPEGSPVPSRAAWCRAAPSRAAVEHEEHGGVGPAPACGAGAQGGRAGGGARRLGHECRALHRGRLDCAAGVREGSGLERAGRVPGPRVLSPLPARRGKSGAGEDIHRPGDGFRRDGAGPRQCRPGRAGTARHAGVLEVAAPPGAESGGSGGPVRQCPE